MSSAPTPNGAAPSGGLTLHRTESKELQSALDLDVERVIAQTHAIQKVMRALMQEGVHFGVVPGTQKRDKDGKDVSKPSLYQPGADKLMLLFRLRADYEITDTGHGDFICIQVRCFLKHIVTGEIWGEGLGSCNSREAKYLNQALAKVCPECKAPAIKRSKFKPGWYCHDKTGGCGAEFREDDAEIVQQIGQVVSGKSWDMHNTILKMACKRARVAAVLTATAASDIFTQDLEDFEELEPGVSINPGPGSKREQQQQAQAQPQTGKPAGKRASPSAIKDLNLALGDLEISSEQRLGWCSSVLGREVTGIDVLSADDANLLTRKARELYMNPPQGGGEQG